MHHETIKEEQLRQENEGMRYNMNNKESDADNLEFVAGFLAVADQYWLLIFDDIRVLY